MKNRAAIISLLMSCMVFTVFIFTGIIVINRTFDNKNDWHFIAAITGVIGSVFLLIVSFAGYLAFLFKSDKRRKSSL